MQALQNHRHLFIEGGPGMGKSTALRYLALTWAQGGVAPWTPVLVSASGLAARKVSLSQALREQVSHELEKYLSRPLPEQIFEEPPPQNTAWLIMIDGLDEIVTLRERQDFLQALSTHLHHASYRFVITSRPLGLAERLSGEQVGYYIMRPFEPSDVETFAQQWFNGDDVEQFQSRLWESQLDDVAQTPLLLTVAAILYQRAPHQPLARQRADFYEQCVTVLLEDEEIQRKRTGQDTSPQERFISDWLLHDPTGGDAAGLVWQWRRQLIERLALSLQQGDLGKLVERAVEVIQANGPGWGESLARRWHDSLAAGLLQRTGVVILHGNDGSFIHETFREYLAASAIAQTYSPDDAEALPLVMRWCDNRWQEVLLFLLGIWARGESGPQAVTALVRQLWERRNRDVPPEEIIALLDFLLGMRSNGIRLEAAAIAAIAEEAAPTLMALTRARAEDSDKPTPTASTLHRLFGSRSVPDQAVFLLTLFGRQQDALSVGQDPLADDYARTHALHLLALSGWEDKALPILLAIGRDAIGHNPEHPSWVRSLAALRLRELGRSEEARSILLTLAKDPADRFTRSMAADDLAELGWLDDVQLLEPILRDSLNRGLFGMHVRALIKTGRLSELPGLAADDDFGVSVREAIARQLDEIARDAEYGYGYTRSGEDDKPSLLAIAGDQAVNSQIRRLAATAVAKLGEGDAAVPILRELLEKQESDASERVAIASVLAELGHVDEVTPALHELAHAMGVSSSVRIQACETLAEHGRWTDVIPSALDIAKNRENGPPIRYRALTLLDKAPDLITDITREEVGEIINLYKELLETI